MNEKDERPWVLCGITSATKVYTILVPVALNYNIFKVGCFGIPSSKGSGPSFSSELLGPKTTYVVIRLHLML